MKLLLIFPLLLGTVSCAVIGTRTPAVQTHENQGLSNFLDDSLTKTSNTFRLIETVSGTLTSLKQENTTETSKTSVLNIISKVLSDSGVGRTVISEDQTQYDYFVKGHIINDIISEIKISGKIDGDKYLMSSLSMRINQSRFYQFFSRQTEGTNTYMEMDFTEITEFGSVLQAQYPDVTYPTILGSLFVRISEGRTIIQTSSLKVDSGPYMLEVDGLKMITDEESKNFSEARVHGSAYSKSRPDDQRAEVTFVIDETTKAPHMVVDTSKLNIDKELGIEAFTHRESGNPTTSDQGETEE